jgi:sugar-specific transcriptional regulator TrmB
VVIIQHQGGNRFIVNEAWVQQLTTLGLNRYEARAYLALLGHDESSAVEVASRANIPRQRIYDVLSSLRDWGMVVAKDGRPTRHVAKEPQIALTSLLEVRRRRRQAEYKRQLAVVETILKEMGQTGEGSRSDRLSAQPIRTEQQKLSGGL